MSLPSEDERRFLVFRKGGVNPANQRPRAKDEGRLSCWDSLTRRTEEGGPAFPPGSEWFAVDVGRLPPFAVEYDNDPPGHVSIVDLPPDVVKAAVVMRGRIPE
jgi:hypothetical protein